MIESDSQLEFGQMPVYAPPTPDGRWEKFRHQVQGWSQALDRLVDAHRTVKMAGMEINLTAIWEFLTWPLRLIFSLFGVGRARSRRGLDPYSSLKKARLYRFLALGAMASVVLGMALFFGLFAWFSRDLPEPGKIVRRDGFSTRIYDRNNVAIYDLFNDERRTPVKIDQVPEYLQQATVAIEDKDFYKHRGFDLWTILRIPYNFVFRKRLVGGSTLTQQLVKNVLLTSDRTISRKFKEFVLSVQIESKFTKDQILEMYLNEAPYGGTAWGVGTAAEIYFNKPVSELDLTESAILAGLPQRPSAYSPTVGRTDENGVPLWKLRTEGVLRRMKEDGYISDLAYEDSKARLDLIKFEKSQEDIKAPHFVFYVRDKLEEMFGPEMVEGGGLQVVTTLDLELHEQAQTIVAEEIEAVKDYGISNGASLIMDPRTGEIYSMVGSADYFNNEIGGQFNVVVDGLRQPGSSIKPVTYLGLLQRGYTPGYMFMDVKTTFVPHENADKYEPNNYDGKFRGPVSLRSSLGSSLNIPAVKGVAILGIEDFLTLAYSMGFPTLEPSEDNLKRFGLAITLGGGEVHLIDTVTAYSSFANGGAKIEPVSILKVTDRDGKVLYEHKHVEGQRVMTSEEAFLINDILSDDAARELAFGRGSMLNLSRAVAVKTGTTNDQRDNWTIGWSQEVIVGTWVGNNDNTPMKRVASGVTGASPIWRKIIQQAIAKGFKTPAWTVPEGVEQVEIDRISGYPAHDEFPSHSEYVIKGTQPSSPDPIHTKIKLCRGENKLANAARVGTGDFEDKEFIVVSEHDPVSTDGANRWQQAVQAWIDGQEDGRYKVPTEYCGDKTEILVRLFNPENERKYDNEDIQFKVEAESGEGIEKLEIYANGNKKLTVDGRTYEGQIKLPRGSYEVWARAISRTGKTKDSDKVKIGTGGADWKPAEASPTPSPTPVGPSPSPTPGPPFVSPSP